ncbi:MAG: hypothetical protein M1836_000848 [Candelina mexicana]|nr:MAG: hypothetical protein M1836_000848 [Candelina mexicana]
MANPSLEAFRARHWTRISTQLADLEPALPATSFNQDGEIDLHSKAGEMIITSMKAAIGKYGEFSQYLLPVVITHATEAFEIIWGEDFTREQWEQYEASKLV